MNWKNFLWPSIRPNTRDLKDVVTVDLTDRIPPFAWSPLVVDAIPTEPELNTMTFVILAMPEDPFSWMEKNLLDASAYLAIYFVVTDFLDVEKVREDVRLWGATPRSASDPVTTFPPGYVILGNRTTLGHCFNVVLPENIK